MIFQIKKRKRKKNGKTVYSKCYSLFYRFGDMPAPKWLALKLTDKEAATAKALDFRKEYEAEVAGIIHPKAIRNGAESPIEDLINEYISDLKKRVKSSEGKTPKQSRTRLLRLAKECGWGKLADVTPDSFIKWRSKTQLAPKTLNHFLGEVVTLLNWLTKQGKLLVNPLAKISKINEKGRETRLRRAFSDSELRRLLEASPPYRSIAYLTAARTGLRLGELASLKWADVSFDSKTPHILGRAATTKNSKDSRIPMTIQLERKLLRHRPDDWKPSNSVFPKGVPRSRTLQIDLKKAGIPYQDDMGRYADFHSLRYTWGTYLQRNGVNSRTAMELMRHSDRKLTDKLYTDSNLLPLGEVIRNLPDDENLIKILTNISGKSGLNGSNSVKTGLVKTEPKNRLEPASLQGKVPKRVFETLVEVAGIEPASRNLSDSASTYVVLLLI